VESCPTLECARARGIRMMGGFRPAGGGAPLSGVFGRRAWALRVLDHFFGAGGGVERSTGVDSSVSNTVIGGGDGGRAAGGEGTRVGEGGGGGVGRVAPMRLLGGKLAAIISRSNSSPTKIRPGVVVSSGCDHSPFEEASSVENVRSPARPWLVGLRTIQVFKHPVGRKPNGMSQIRAMPRGTSKGAGPCRGPWSGRWKPRSRERS
jgi:hypothetical protein